MFLNVTAPPRSSPSVNATDGVQQELLNSIAAIQAAAEILEDHDDLSVSDRRGFLSAIQSETERLHRMISE